MRNYLPKIITGIITAAALGACAPHYDAGGFQATPVDWTYWKVSRDPQYLAKDVAANCFTRGGTALRDRSGCVVLHRGRCTYITLPGDDHAIHELNAIAGRRRSSSAA